MRIVNFSLQDLPLGLLTGFLPKKKRARLMLASSDLHEAQSATDSKKLRLVVTNEGDRVAILTAVRLIVDSGRWLRYGSPQMAAIPELTADFVMDPQWLFPRSLEVAVEAQVRPNEAQAVTTSVWAGRPPNGAESVYLMHVELEYRSKGKRRRFKSPRFCLVLPPEGPRQVPYFLHEIEAEMDRFQEILKQFTIQSAIAASEAAIEVMQDCKYEVHNLNRLALLQTAEEADLSDARTKELLGRLGDASQKTGTSKAV